MKGLSSMIRAQENIIQDYSRPECLRSVSKYLLSIHCEHLLRPSARPREHNK